ncbi:hypothetical protein QE429_004601 [Bacillus sp. SORGH_AS 510]|uniref:hypothetical protein n=1 Tax=Bacillus sp. SORGH_AS_0510 TaxID=3041771 RepID=UPI002781089E|nr:hypothetical protein [Bacillus sp. SORGH_AS_0510]MDQ1147774.1 hypothetical protein [Bacillus sp. SORGH_AS_0510]
MRTRNVKPDAYGSLYKQDGIVLPAVTGEFLDFDMAGPSQNTRPDVTANRISIFKSGVYQITADVSVLIKDGQSVLFNINLCPNGTLPLIGSDFDVINMSMVTGITVQAYLNVGDQVGIFIADTFAPVGRAKYNRASLTLHLLDP